MSGVDGLRKTAAANVDESSGAYRAAGRALPAPAAPDPRWDDVARAKGSYVIPVGRIVRDETQPREAFDPDALARLAESMRTRGQIQPVRVRWDEGRGAYVVIAGERRWRAAALAGLAAVACVVDDRALTADDRLALQLVENALREDLKPVEQARAYQRLMDAHGYTQQGLARELQVTQSQVSSALRLLDLPAPVREQVDRGELAPRTAYEITKLPDPADQLAVAAAAAAEGLTRAEVTEFVRAVKSRRPAPAARPDPVTVEVGDWTVRLTCRKASDLTPAQVLAAALKRFKGQGGGAAA